MSYNNKIVIITLSVLALFAIGYLICSYNSGSTLSNIDNRTPMNSNIENFQGENTVPVAQQNVVDASDNIQYIEQPQVINNNTNNNTVNQLPSECYPKDVLSSADLLPRDANSLWAQVSPSGQGSLADQNFLTSGFHIGINTVGQSLRNANRQTRSEPLNPQVKVSPWHQSTIEPDINRRPLEIQGDL